MAEKIILDTDIGDDIDDAMALALMLASPELDLQAVTTVFGNVAARSRQARTLLKLAGERFTRIPVAAGCGGTMASRRMGNRGTLDYLNGVLPNQDSTCLPEADLAPPDPRHGVDLLIELIMNGGGDVIPVPIGAMTNIAMAMVKEPRIAAKIPRIVSMSAEFKRGFAEWNIRCDPEAAAIVFSSGVPIHVTTWDIGHTVRFRQAEIDRLAASPRPVAQYLARAIRAWQDSHGDPSQPAMPSLYDPMAVATMVRPELCTWKTGTVTVELRGDSTYGFTTFREHADGPHRVAWDADRDASFEFYLSRVLAL
jgi:purine nucleosidase/pyrimidine-specific ribonucleoside hydrolase